MQIQPLGTNPSTVIQHSSAVIPAPSLSFPHPSAPFAVIPAVFKRESILDYAPPLSFP